MSTSCKGSPACFWFCVFVFHGSLFCTVVALVPGTYRPANICCLPPTWHAWTLQVQRSSCPAFFAPPPSTSGPIDCYPLSVWGPSDRHADQTHKAMQLLLMSTRDTYAVRFAANREKPSGSNGRHSYKQCGREGTKTCHLNFLSQTVES